MQRRTPETKNNHQVPEILLEQEKAKVDVLTSQEKDMTTSKERRLDLSSEPSLYMRNSLARKYSSRSFDVTPRSGRIV
jgi:hypothetical protein